MPSLAIIGASLHEYSTSHEAISSNSVQQPPKQVASPRGPGDQKLAYPFDQPRGVGAPTFPDNRGRCEPISSPGREALRANVPPVIIAIKPQGTPTPDPTSAIGAPFEETTVEDLEVRIRRGSRLKRLVRKAENTTAVATNSEELRLMPVNTATAIDTPPMTPVEYSDRTENSPGLGPCFESPLRLNKEYPKDTHMLSALDTLQYNLWLKTHLSRGGVYTDTGSVPHKIWPFLKSDHRLYASTAKEFRPPTPPPSEDTGSFEDLESPLDSVIVVANVLTKFIILLRAEASFLLSSPDSGDPQSAFALFEGLLATLKDLTYVNDVEFPETGKGDEDTAKYRFEGRPCRMFQEGSCVCFSFKPVGTTALNKSLCTLLHKVTGPIQIMGKCPLKTFDGSSKGGADEVKHKRRMAEREYQSFLKAARSLWGNLSAKKQHQLCKGVVDALVVLFLYWGYYLCLEQRLHLAENDRQKVKKACQDQLEKITLACIDKEGRIKGSSFIMIYQEDAEECHYGAYRYQSRNNSRSGRSEDGRDNSQVRERSRSRARNQSSYGRPASSREAGERIGPKTDKHRRAEQPRFDHQQHERDRGSSTQERPSPRNSRGATYKDRH